MGDVDLRALHRHSDEHPHGHPVAMPRLDRRDLFRVSGLGLCGALLAACSSTATSTPSTTGSSVTTSPSVTTAPAAPTTAEIPVSTVGGGTLTVPATVTSDVLAGFDAFAATVHVARDGDMWVVESTGMPTHSMMTGIRSWQQQFPLPQAYAGTNAFRFPATPVLAATPLSARHALFNGAIALAVDGVPIFNALNNRGDDAFLAGELDNWGGHSGRADDYHYHAAPLYLQQLVGPGKPIAYALDGFAIYGDTEPDGSPMTALDDLNGHVGSDGVYHYHGTTTYPYINGGLRGVVSVVNDHIDPQPTTHPFRPDGTPLRGATITGFDTGGAGQYQLTYSLAGGTYTVAWTITGNSVTFTYTAADGTTRTEQFTRRG